MTLTFPTICLSQNILFLKNGDKLNGKLEGYKNDSIIFKFQGNRLKLKTNEIISIFFDDKAVPQNQNKVTNTAESKPITGNITGVVTYYFNENYGDKPDIGAEVYAADSTQIPDFSYATVDSFYHGNFYRNIWLQYKELKILVPEDILKQVKKWNVEDKVIFDSLDRKATINFLKIKNGKDNYKTVVDGSGKYIITVKPGTYYIIIKSNNLMAHLSQKLVEK